MFSGFPGCGPCGNTPADAGESSQGFTIDSKSLCEIPRQALAEGFAERAAGLVDLNERALTLRTGGLRGEEDDAGPRGPYQDGQYNNNRGGCAVFPLFMLSYRVCSPMSRREMVVQVQSQK